MKFISSIIAILVQCSFISLCLHSYTVINPQLVCPNMQIWNKNKQSRHRVYTYLSGKIRHKECSTRRTNVFCCRSSFFSHRRMGWGGAGVTVSHSTQFNPPPPPTTLVDKGSDDICTVNCTRTTEKLSFYILHIIGAALFSDGPKAYRAFTHITQSSSVLEYYNLWYTILRFSVQIQPCP